MTKILHIIETADPAYGGPIEGTRRTGEIWARQGHVQDLLTLDSPDEDHLSDYPGRIIPIGPPRSRNPLHRYRYSPRMIPWLREHAREYDAVLVSGLWRYFARGAWKGLEGTGIPYFVYTHGMLDPWFRRTYPLKHAGKQLSWWFAEGPLLAGAKAVLFTTEEEQLLARNAFWPYRAEGAVVGYGTQDVDGDPDGQVAAFRAATPQLAGRRFLLFLSRIHPKKGCDLLIDAFAVAARVDPGLDLVIAGPDQMGLTAGLQAQAERLGIAGRVHFPGMLTGEVKFGAFRASEAFVLTSHQENFGVVVAEALACGKAVLISDKVNIWREVVADGAGMVEPDTPEGSQRLLARFQALGPEDRSAMEARARQCFARRFHVERAAAALMELIEAT